MSAGQKPLLAEEKEPLSQLEATVNRIIDILQEEETGDDWEQQEQRILSLIEERLDHEEIAKRALARHWRDINDEQRKEFTSLFLQLLKDTYINRLKNCSCEADANFYEQRKRGDRAIVYSKVRNEQKGQETPIDYRLIKKDGEWGIYDIIVEGTSLISNYRKQFDRIMKRSGYSELSKKLREKLEQE
ncbi:MAG: phospholipid-binding protein MlaC [Desulfurivibrionaceae bacterium]